ncbi:hypothetical protein C8T65DRAFT_587797 [Cerioporus squamosus]|nr:hypothetical protein C8T65DRAFT_587797 [Cerioporus squamosus]
MSRPCSSNSAVDVQTGLIPLHLGVDFPSLMDTQSRTLNELLAYSNVGSKLALSVKHAELAAHDLVYIIKASSMATKASLSSALEEFAEEARVVSRQLQYLSAKMDGAVDTVLAFDEYALRILVAARDAGVVDVPATTARIFHSAMGVLASEVGSVLADATSVTTALDLLEEKLSSVHVLSIQERMATRAAVEGHLSKSWMILGYKAAIPGQLVHRLEVLDDLDHYHRRSDAHVTATTQSLVMMEADLSELHRKLAASQYTSGKLPIEVHIASIEQSARRLLEQRAQDRGRKVMAADVHGGEVGGI